MTTGATGATGAAGLPGDDAPGAGSGGYPVRGPHSSMFLFDTTQMAGDNQGTANLQVPDSTWTKLSYWKAHTVNDLSGQFQTHNAYNETAHFHCMYTGVYLVQFQVQWPANAVGSRIVQIRENQSGTSNIRGHAQTQNAGGNQVRQQVTSILSLSGNPAAASTYDTMGDGSTPQSFTEFWVWQDSGSTLTLVHVDDVAPRCSQTFLRIPGHHAFPGDAAYEAWGSGFGYYA
jgi:hypothetical protein